MSYATPADIRLRYDERLLGSLVSDSGTAVSGGALLSDDVLQACLDDASGDIDTALLAGATYTTDDLVGLSGNSLAKLKRICCDVAISYLADRRVYTRLNETIERIIDRAAKTLKLLHDGEQMFDIPAKVAASVPAVTGPTTATLVNLNTIARRTNHFYPNEILPGNR